MSAGDRQVHPQRPELVGGLSLSVPDLEARQDEPGVDKLLKLLKNAAYWIGFEVAPFEPLVARCPTPIREIGVGVILRFGEGVDGRIRLSDVEVAETELLEGLPPDLHEAIAAGLATLRRAVETRDRLKDLEAEGFRPYVPKQSLSVHSLMANMGRAHLNLNGEPVRDRQVRVEVGAPLRISSSDDRGRALERPEVEGELSGLILSRDEADPGVRTLVLPVPGMYRVRVPGRAEGAKQLLAG